MKITMALIIFTDMTALLYFILLQNVLNEIIIKIIPYFVNHIHQHYFGNEC